MAQRTNDRWHPFWQWMGPGMVAGMVFAMWTMIVGIFYSALWAPPQGIAQSVGIGSQGHNFMVLPFILGIMGHMINSAIIGMIFIGIVRMLRVSNAVVLAMLGVIWGLIVYWVLYAVVFAGLLPTTSQSFVSSNPDWSWILAHVMFGMVLGLVAAYGPMRVPAADHTGYRGPTPVTA